jgi:hypothetical protein
MERMIESIRLSERPDPLPAEGRRDRCYTIGSCWSGADLAFRQGELRRARHLLDLLLGRNHDHPRRRRSRQGDRRAGRGAARAAHRRGWLDDGDPSSLRWALTLGGLFVLGCACVAAGLWLGLDILKQGMKLGFGHRVLANPSGRPGFAAHYPLHSCCSCPSCVVSSWLPPGCCVSLSRGEGPGDHPPPDSRTNHLSGLSLHPYSLGALPTSLPRYRPSDIIQTGAEKEQHKLNQKEGAKGPAARTPLYSLYPYLTARLSR